MTQTKQESKIIPNIPRNLLTVCNYSCEFLTQASVKILSLTYIKYVWLDYPKTLNKIEAKIIVCRINSTTLSSQSFISKVYKATGLATASLDCIINCLKIMDNNKTRLRRAFFPKDFFSRQGFFLRHPRPKKKGSRNQLF